MAHLGHSIKVVAKMTGLTTHVIRVWEKRYQAVSPARTGTNRRLYSSEEIERLSLLRLAVSSGHSIRNIAGLPTSDLRNLVGHALTEATQSRLEIPAPPGGGTSCPAFVAEAIDAVIHLDSAGLDRVLSRASVELTQPTLLQDVLVPLIHQIGDLWQKGNLKVAHEHVATAAIRTFVGSFIRQSIPGNFAPTLVVATPAGQLHELGAILVAAAANNHGWRVCYLGPSLPAAEIAAAVIQNQARAVAVSIVYPEDDPHLDAELEKLRSLLPARVALLAGGRAALHYADALQKAGATICQSISDVSSALSKLRSVQRPRAQGAT